MIRASLLVMHAMTEMKELEAMFTMRIAVARALILCLDALMTPLVILIRQRKPLMAHVCFLAIPATMA
jgi:hypothetical protein